MSETAAQSLPRLPETRGSEKTPDPRGLLIALAITLAGLLPGIWQAAAPAAILGAYLSRRRPVLSTTLGTMLGWLLHILLQMATPGGRIIHGLGGALGLPGGALLFILGSLGVALAIALPGACLGRGLRGLSGSRPGPP